MSAVGRGILVGADSGIKCACAVPVDARLLSGARLTRNNVLPDSGRGSRYALTFPIRPCILGFEIFKKLDC